jgi:aryl-alcohol dehydrogenase
MQITAAPAKTRGGDFSIETVELDDPRADEIRVRMAAVAVCHTDLVARDGAMPFAFPAVLGHDGAGVVDAVGASVTSLAPAS